VPTPGIEKIDSIIAVVPIAVPNPNAARATVGASDGLRR